MKKAFSLFLMGCLVILHVSAQWQAVNRNKSDGSGEIPAKVNFMSIADGKLYAATTDGIWESASMNGGDWTAFGLQGQEVKIINFSEEKLAIINVTAAADESKTAGQLYKYNAGNWELTKFNETREAGFQPSMGFVQMRNKEDKLIFVLPTWGQGIWRSEDGGETWTQSQLLTDEGGLTVCKNTIGLFTFENDSVIYGTDKASGSVAYLLRSFDYGKTWEYKDGGYVFNPWSFHKRMYNGVETYYFGGENGTRSIQKSVDKGSTWVSVPNTKHHNRCMLGKDDGPLFVMFGQDGVYVSKDDGASIEPLGTGFVITNAHSKSLTHMVMTDEKLYCSAQEDGIQVFDISDIETVVSVPTDNPYKSQYPDAYPAWTDELKWNQTVNIKDFEPDADGYWDTALNEAMAQLEGGGTVFFPAGTYRFQSDVTLTDGIILRGEKPLYTDARESNFAPPSRLVFPKYEPVFEGDGTPNSTAFKQINVTTGASNIGLVHLDINRATIYMGNGTSTGVLVFGVRNNNAAIPQSDIPDKSKGQHGWQRYSYRFGVNIAANGNEKISVVGCRVNDLENNTVHPIEDDSYDQPGYVATGKFKGPADKPTGATRASIVDGVIKESDTTHIANGAWARFNYLDHYGIRVSGQRLNPLEVSGTVDQQIEVIDNWVLTTIRVGYFTEGIGMTVRGNVKKDIEGKRVFISPDGKSLQANNSATYENRGLNFAGENIVIEDNDIQVERHNILYSGYASVDGEGILIQWQDPWGFDSGNPASGKDTRINHVVIRNNRLNAYIGIYDIQVPQTDIHITGNDLLNKANINFFKKENTYRSDNIHIEDNVNVTGISLNCNSGPISGCNLYIRNNSGSGAIRTSEQCIIENNTGFTEEKITPLGKELFMTELFPYYNQLDATERDTILVRFNQPVELVADQGIKVEGDQTGTLKIKKVEADSKELRIILEQPLTEKGEKITVTLPANAVTWNSYGNEEFTWSFFMLSDGEGETPVKLAETDEAELSLYYDSRSQELAVLNSIGTKGVIDVFSIDGTQVKRLAVNGEETIRIYLPLNGGVYIVRFQNAQGEAAGKFVAY